MFAPTRRHYAIISVVFVLVLAGCLSVTVEVSVGSDGDIDEMQVEMTMDEFVFEMMEEGAQEDGYESLEAQFSADIEEEEWGSFDYSEEREGDDVIITMTANDGDPDNLDDISIVIEDDEMTYTDADGFATDEDDEELDEFRDQIEMEYILNMPGEIVESNGDVSEDGDSVSWNFHDHGDVDAFTATAEVPEDAEDDSIPGFSIPLVLAVFVLMGIGAVGSRRVRST